jgi:putative ABC transport system permease protein
MALGASRGNVQVLVFRQGFLTTAIGLVIGLGATHVLMRVLRGMLVGLESEGFGGILIAVGVVSLISAIACWVPARRAAKIDPMAALRHD